MAVAAVTGGLSSGFALNSRLDFAHSKSKSGSWICGS